MEEGRGCSGDGWMWIFDFVKLLQLSGNCYSLLPRSLRYCGKGGEGQGREGERRGKGGRGRERRGCEEEEREGKVKAGNVREEKRKIKYWKREGN